MCVREREREREREIEEKEDRERGLAMSTAAKKKEEEDDKRAILLDTLRLTPKQRSRSLLVLSCVWFSAGAGPEWRREKERAT